MKKYINKFYAAAILAGLSLTACKPEIETVTPSAGEADFSRYVALGNSLTSGYANSALYLEGQQVAYPNLIAQQLKLVGGGEFKQPYVKSGVDLGVPDFVYPMVYLPGRLKLKTVQDCNGDIVLSPSSTITDSIDISNLSNLNSIFDLISPSTVAPYNNLGAPLALSTDLNRKGFGNPDPFLTLPGRLLSGQTNIFYLRMLFNDNTNPDKNISIVENAVKQNPTFFTLWIGNNDALFYAGSGGEDSGEDITPVAVFSAAVDSTVKALTANNAKGAIANIPYTHLSPFFNTVPYNGLVLTRQGQVDSLNAGYALLGSQIGVNLNLTFNLGQNPFVVEDEVTGLPRFIKQDEKILLNIANSIKCNKRGSATPIPSTSFLSTAEISRLKSSIDGYNAKLKSLAAEYNLAYVDANTYLSGLQTGVMVNSVNYTNTFVSGGVFSLDGLHLSPKGNALVANLFIDAINRTYNSRIPAVDVNAHSGILFP